jgi:UDP-glucose 4-epimerase
MGIMLTGPTGMIGSNLKDLLPPMLCPTHQELELTDKQAIEKYVFLNNITSIINCASNDDEDCLFDNLKMFVNLAELNIPMITFCTGLEEENRSGKSGQYVLSKRIIRELALHKYKHILVIRIWGCFGMHEQPGRFITNNFLRIQQGLPITVKENRLFSYVYVKDLVKIIKDLEITSRLINVVGYTQTLFEYAQIIKQVTKSPHPIICEKGSFQTSYFGKNDFNFEYTPLETAIGDFWSDFNNNTFSA